jgi:hypothetical protein
VDPSQYDPLKASISTTNVHDLQLQVANLLDTQNTLMAQRKEAVKNLVQVDEFLEQLWSKADNKKLNVAISALRDALSTLEKNPK